MALVVCRECNGQVSDLATACPKCGCPVTPAQSQSRQQKVTWAEAQAEGQHLAWRQSLITDVVGKEPSLFLWWILPFAVAFVMFAAAGGGAAVGAGTIAAALIGGGRYFSYYARRREIGRLSDEDLQAQVLRAKGIQATVVPTKREGTTG